MFGTMPVLIGFWLIGSLILGQVPSSEGEHWEDRDRVSRDPNDWPMYNHDARGTRFNAGERKLSRASVSKLQQKWVYPTAGDVYATPVVVDDILYAGDTSGAVYALTRDGQPVWQSSVKGRLPEAR
jgi:glucose dehydrogenase